MGIETAIAIGGTLAALGTATGGIISAVKNKSPKPMPVMLPKPMTVPLTAQQQTDVSLLDDNKRKGPYQGGSITSPLGDLSTADTQRNKLLGN